jgi:hypothetical protein
MRIGGGGWRSDGRREAAAAGDGAGRGSGDACRWISNSLFNIDVASPGAAPAATAGPYIDGHAAGRDIEGLARVDGVLYGIDPRAPCTASSSRGCSRDTWSVAVHDELSPFFTIRAT